MEIAVSHTTRMMLDDEEDGVTYHYVTHSEFLHLINTGEMLTYKQFIGHYFGISIL